MIQYKFGVSKSPPNHYNTLSHLRLPEWSHPNRPLSSRSRQNLKNTTPSKKPRENAPDVQHYYSTKNLQLHVQHKQTLKTETVCSPQRPKPKKPINLAAQNSARAASASQQKQLRKPVDKFTVYRPSHCESIIQLSNRFTRRNVQMVSEGKLPNFQVERMAKEIAKLKEQNQRLSKLYKNTMNQKQSQKMRIRDYEVQVEQKNLTLKKRITNLNCELRECKSNQKIIYHLDTYQKINPEAYSPAFVANRIQQAAMSIQESIERGLSLSSLMKTQHNTDTCESPLSGSLKKDDTETISELSLESQKCVFTNYDS